MPTVQPLPIDVLIAEIRSKAPATMPQSQIDEQVRNREMGEKWRRFSDRIGKRYQECRFSNFDAPSASQQAVVDSLGRFTSGFAANLSEGRGLVFLGPRGTGKDHLAVAAVRECIRYANVTADWVDGQSLFSEFRDRISDDEGEGSRIRQLVVPQILLISDPVPQDGKLTDYQQGLLWQIVDGRYRRMQSTWITANATSEGELCSKMGAQLVDRIVGGAMIVLTTGWKSQRVPGEIVK